MELMRYHEELLLGYRPALVLNEGRKWMDLLVVDHGRLRILKRSLDEKKYMTPLVTNERKAKASIRRLARKKGTSKRIREAVKECVA